MSVNGIYTNEQVNLAPSICETLSKEKENHFRVEGCKIISEVGTHMGFQIKPTIATACVYFHRFYMKLNFQEYPREITALGCLFLAGKVEETPKKCRDLCTQATTKFPNIYLKYPLPILADEVMGTERLLLHVLKFDLQIDQPYDALIEYKKMFPQLTKDEISEVTQIAWTFINDSYYTTLCLTTEPQIIAIALLHLAFAVKSINPVAEGADPCWWSQDVSNWPVEDVDKTCHLVLDFYQTTKNTPVLTNGSLTDPAV